MTVKNELGMEKHTYSNDDEIDLFDLVDDIWSHKGWVVIGLLVTVLVAGLYLWKATPVYETESIVKAPTGNDLIEFSRPQLQGGYVAAKTASDDENSNEKALVAKAPVFEMTVESAFSFAQSALMSTGYRKDFYELKLNEIKALPSGYNENLTLEQNFSNFNNQFAIKMSDKKEAEPFVQISLELTDTKLASQLLNEFVEYALARRLNASYRNMQAKVNDRIELLNYQSQIIREEYLGDKSRRILELKEAYEIAKAVGQDNPVYRNMDLMGGQLPPLYMLGTKAINAEIKALESRTTMAKDLPRGEDHFIKGLPTLLLEIDALKMLKVDPSKIKLARIDQIAIVPISPVKPRKLLIMALAIVAGLFVGLFMALIVAAYKKHRARTALS